MYIEIESSSEDGQKPVTLSDSDQPTSEAELSPNSAIIRSSDLAISNYVVDGVHSKKIVKHFAASILDADADEDTATVSFLVRHGSNFVALDHADLAMVDEKDIDMLLPKPTMVGGTARTCKQISFNIVISNYFELLIRNDNALWTIGQPFTLLPYFVMKNVIF